MNKLITRIFIILITLFQLSIIAFSASPMNLDQYHHIGSSDTYTYDEIESFVSVKVGFTGGLSRGLSVEEVRADRKVLVNVASVAAKGATGFADDAIRLTTSSKSLAHLGEVWAYFLIAKPMYNYSTKAQ